MEISFILLISNRVIKSFHIVQDGDRMGLFCRIVLVLRHKVRSLIVFGETSSISSGSDPFLSEKVRFIFQSYNTVFLCCDQVHQVVISDITSLD